MAKKDPTVTWLVKSAANFNSFRAAGSSGFGLSDSCRSGSIVLMKSSAGRLFSLAFAGLVVAAQGQTGPQMTQLTPAQLWQRLEFSITNVPPSANPFDPDRITVDASFILPSQKVMVVPGFWFQDYQRGLSGSYEILTTVGVPHWRLR